MIQSMESMPGDNISKDEQYTFASRMEAEFPEGEEFLLELFQDHVTALKQMPLDPQVAVKNGAAQYC